MESSPSDSSSYNDPKSHHSPLIPELPDHIAFFCLARVPRKYFAVLKCVSKSWRQLVCSKGWREYRQKHNLSETWIYALCRDKISDQIYCCVLDPGSARQGWKSVLGIPPRCLKRKGMGFEAVGDKLYLLGGCAWFRDPTNEVYCYDVSTNAWSEVSPMPTARCYHSCVAVDSKIYAMGGYGNQAVDRFSWDTYDPCTNTWKSHSDPKIALDIEDAVVMDGKIHVRLIEPNISNRHIYTVVSSPSSVKVQQADTNMASGWKGPAVIVDNSLYVLDQRYGTKLVTWDKDIGEWVDVCRLSPQLTRPPCQMAAIGKNIFIVGKGLSTVILDVGNISNADRVTSSLSIPVLSSDDNVISCRCVSI